MKTITIEWDLLGAQLATLSEVEQSKFFKGFARELMAFESHYMRELQMLSVKNELSKKDRDVLSEYLPCLWFEEELGQ